MGRLLAALSIVLLSACGEPVQWVIDGQEASAFMGGKRVEFERVDGRWYCVEEVVRTKSTIVNGSPIDVSDD